MDRYDTPHLDDTAGEEESARERDTSGRLHGSSAIDDARKLIQIMGAGARRTVATGATGQFGDWLGWPTWLTRGTSLPRGVQLPDRITLADDLILLANIVDNGMAPTILSRLFIDFKIPGAPITVPALYNAPTLKDALDFFVRTAAFGSPFLKAHLDQNAGHFAISIDSELASGPMRDFCSIAMLSVAYRFVSFFVVDEITNIQIEIEAEQGSPLVKPLGHLPCKFVFEADRYAIHGAAEWLNLENWRSDKAFWNFALERMTVAERQGGKSEIVGRIRTAVSMAMQSEARVPRLKQVAVLEGVSERTLVRTLAAQGIKFHQIIEEERRIKAAELIGNASLSLSDIARQLGFTDMSSFGRSYRQWFGVTPGQARARRNA